MVKPPPAKAQAVSAATERKIEFLYTNDNWLVRRRILFHAIYWKILLVTATVIVSLFVAVFRTGAVASIIESLLTIVVPALLLSISAEVAAYVFGANQDDANKRANLSSATEEP